MGSIALLYIGRIINATSMETAVWKGIVVT